PNLFRRLFAEGAFNSAFIPLFAKELEGGGHEAAKKFSEQVLSVLTAWLLLLSGVAIILMPLLTRWIIAPGFADDPDKLNMTVLMTQIMFPYLLCMSLVAMLSGMLNSMRRYFLAAFVPILLNVGMIGVLVFTMGVKLDQRETGLWLSWGVLVSGFAQLACLYWAVRREGFPMRRRAPRLTPDVRKLLILMAPAL